jgi:hypothetical protein
MGLVVNMIVLWNTLYINAALEQLAREGHHVTPQDVARLSPLVAKRRLREYVSQKPANLGLRKPIFDLCPKA